MLVKPSENVPYTCGVCGKEVRNQKYPLVGRVKSEPGGEDVPLCKDCVQKVARTCVGCGTIELPSSSGQAFNKSGILTVEGQYYCSASCISKTTLRAFEYKNSFTAGISPSLWKCGCCSSYTIDPVYTLKKSEIGNKLTFNGSLLQCSRCAEAAVTAGKVEWLTVTRELRATFRELQTQYRILVPKGTEVKTLKDLPDTPRIETYEFNQVAGRFVTSPVVLYKQLYIANGKYFMDAYRDWETDRKSVV